MKMKKKVPLRFELKSRFVLLACLIALIVCSNKDFKKCILSNNLNESLIEK